MSRPSRRNSGLKFFVNGKAAKSLHGLADVVGKALSRYDTAVQRATVGLKRRAAPATNRAVIENYNVKRSTLTSAGAYRVEEGIGRKGDYLSIWASTRALPLIEFGGKWGGPSTTGATAEIVRGQRKTYTHAFIATGSLRGTQGKKVIYTRLRGQKKKQNKGYHAGKVREPIRQLRGPSPYEMLSGIDGHRAALNTRRAVLAELTDYYIGELQRQFALSRK